MGNFEWRLCEKEFGLLYAGVRFLCNFKLIVVFLLLFHFRKMTANVTKQVQHIIALTY
jgi:hypothetical protein